MKKYISYTAIVMALNLAGNASSEILEEVVVTGSADGSEVRKLDASYAITNVTAEDIVKFSPKSTADLLKTIPGVWAESSGGVSGANIFVRGMPGGGDAPYYTLQIEGAPVYPAPTLSFLENTTLFRIDETVERVEGLRGGPQSVQDNGQPGLTTNFLLKRGQEETEGLVKYSTSDYDLQRFDARMSGKLTDGLYYMIGGYVSSSPGIRDAGYQAEKGHQFTIKLTKELENGELSVYHRATDDHGTWYLPGALNVPGVDNTYIQNGTLNRKQTIMLSNGDSRNVDMADGRGWDGTVSGINFDLEINDQWSLSNALNYTSGDADTVGFVSNGGAVTVESLLGGDTTGAVTGRSISGDEYTQQWGLWEVRKNIESMTNNLSLTGSYDKVDATVGLYAATTSVDEFWALGNHQYYVVENGGEMITGAECPNSCGWNYDIDAAGDAKDRALYGTVTFRATDSLSFDVGVRNANHEVNYSVDEGLAGSISKVVDYDESQTSYTVGANLALDENSGVFFRASHGYRLPFFDDFRDNYGAYSDGDDLTQKVAQYELGYKFSGKNISAYVTGFVTEVEDAAVSLPGTPAVDSVQEAKGLELDIRYVASNGFQVLLNGTIQDTEITEGSDAGIIGNESQRQPGYQLRISPSYDFSMSNSWSGTVYGSLSLVDDRWSDNGNTVELPGYEKVDLGLIVNASDNLTLQLMLDNLTDEEGLTEGDPRNPTAPNGRYIMPRNIKFSVGYNF
jgi:iron complex outermembrane receptor protein